MNWADVDDNAELVEKMRIFDEARGQRRCGDAGLIAIEHGYPPPIACPYGPCETCREQLGDEASIITFVSIRGGRDIFAQSHARCTRPKWWSDRVCNEARNTPQEQP